MVDWNFEKGKKACSQCERVFASEEFYRSALFENGETFERRNFCLTCWDAGVGTPFSHWKTQTERKEEKREDKQTLIDLWENIGNTSELEGQRLKLAFLVSMSLVRKRYLRMDAPIYREGKELLVLTRTGDHHQFLLPQPDITEEELKPLYDELSKLLGVAV